MPGSRILISSQTLTSAAATVTFSSIPATYTDLVLKFSVRSNQANVARTYFLKINGSSSAVYSSTILQGDGSAAISIRYSDETAGIRGTNGMPGTSATANTFSNSEIYIPNYTSTTNKPVSLFGVTENNATESYIDPTAGLARITSAITSITLTTADNFVSDSSFYLYGLKNS